MPVEKNFAQAEMAAYETEPSSSAKIEIREALNQPSADVEGELRIFTTALEALFANPVSEEKGALRLKTQMERFVEEDKATLAWLSGEEEAPEMLLLVADRAEREADRYLFFC